jgi:Protein of unknown function (DUF992)
MLWHRQVRAAGTAPFSILCSHHVFSAGDFLMRRSLILAGTAIATLVASIFGANAQQPMQRVQVGVLECRGGASVGFIVGSVTNLGCVLRVEGMPEDRYIATIRKVGLDLGITQESALAWGVYAPVARLAPGDLSGNYAGAQGSATLGVGVGGNVLVGGSNNSIALQPLSVQGQVGVNIAAGLESLELRPGR